MDNIISVKNLTYKFDNYEALDCVSFDVKTGEIVSVIGPNGSGKTTLIKNIIGVYKPTSGIIKIKGEEPKKSRSIIGYVPQRFDFDRSIPISVYEFMGLEKCGKKKHGCVNIKESLKQVGLVDVEKKSLGSLSGGQFQRMMIARSLLHEKEILIFDEPSTGIDIAGEQTVYDLIVKIYKERGTTCVMVSHELNIVSKYSNRVLCLNKKKICYGAPETVINSKNLKDLYGISAGLYHSH